MLDIRKIFAHQPQVALAEADTAAALPFAALVARDVTPTLNTFLESWPVNAGPFFMADGQSAVAFAALLQTPEFALQDVA